MFSAKLSQFLLNCSTKPKIFFEHKASWQMQARLKNASGSSGIAAFSDKCHLKGSCLEKPCAVSIHGQEPH